ncbi:MAG: hypothetical protein SF029_04060 [bacterium]|nr:hypothetical protein [bacterium]
MEGSEIPAHVRINNVFLSTTVSSFILTTPPDDRQLVVDDSVAAFMARVGGQPADFSPLLFKLPKIPVFASRVDLLTVGQTLPIVVMGRFTYKGIKPNGTNKVSCELAAHIFLSTDPESETMLEDWQRNDGLPTNFV